MNLTFTILACTAVGLLSIYMDRAIHERFCGTETSFSGFAVRSPVIAQLGGK